VSGERPSGIILPAEGRPLAVKRTELIVRRTPSDLFTRSVVFAKDADGGIAIYDKDMQLVKRLSADDISRIKERMVN